MRIAEVFESIQGEGAHTGTRSVFVRTTGCNLRCWFCDTPYTSWVPEGPITPWTDVAGQILAYNCPHVVITGGEPLLQPEVVPLSQRLTEEGCYVTVETAGTLLRPVQADLMSISPKLANSTPASSRWKARHDARRTNLDVIRQLMADYDYQFKFVVDQPADLEDVETYLAALPPLDPFRIWLMPQGTDPQTLEHRAEWLAPAAERMGVQFSPRRHIELYGNVRGR